MEVCMLNRIVPVFLSICLICGCCPANKKSPSAVTIDNIEITSDEYQDAFKNSPYAASGSPEAKKEFLNNFITRMLILREAERTGTDKDPEFLKSVQLFWQQSLIKLMIDKKIKALAGHIGVSDAEVKDYYSAGKDSEFKGTELPAVYDRIKWIIFNKKQSALLDDWINSLRGEAKIIVNKSSLGTGG